jgi:hypothetical protein
MNPLQRALIEKSGNDNGFEYVYASEASSVSLASARHPTRVLVNLENEVRFQATSPTLLLELRRSFPQIGVESGGFTLATEDVLAALLRRAAKLSRALPSQAANDYQQAVAAELANLPAGVIGTEVERLVRQPCKTLSRVLIGCRTAGLNPRITTPIDVRFQHAQAVHDGIKSGRFADEHARVNHALKVIAQRNQGSVAWNQSELPKQTGIIVGIACVIEDLFVLDDICKQGAISHSFPINKIHQHCQVVPVA